MKRTYYITFLLCICLFVLTNCDKQKRAAKKLTGDWELVSYSKTDWEGMTEYGSSITGGITFEAYDGDSSNYIMQVTSSFPSSNGNFDQKGSYKMTDKGDYMYISTLDSQGLVTSYIKYRILMLNSTDLQLEFTGSDYYYRMMIFKRK